MMSVNNGDIVITTERILATRIFPMDQTLIPTLAQSLHVRYPSE
jgi:hypothetical protein